MLFQIVDFLLLSSPCTPEERSRLNTFIINQLEPFRDKVILPQNTDNSPTLEG